MTIQIKDFNIYITFPVQTIFKENNSTWYLEKILLYIIPADKYEKTDRIRKLSFSKP